SIRGLNLQVLEGDYLPIVKIAPIYPHHAVSQGIEGSVVVEFTVTTSGAVRDVVVIDAQPKGVFEKSAIEAALRFRYRPRVVDGEPIEVRGVRNVFRFSLTD
ncbi:MAG TPA: energy transducer TonB, partial [bacterium]|nr:energy transducer TonB [bacterium]